jgi:hypothetical protein
VPSGDALDVPWVAANPDVAPARADEHERLLVLGERWMEQKYRRPVEPLTDEEQIELKRLAARYNSFRAPWTLATDRERIDLIKASWDAAAAEQIDYVYEVIQRQNNALLHPSPLGYGLAMSPGRKQINRIGPDGRWRDALAHGVLGFYLVLRVLAKEYQFDIAPAERMFNYASCLSRTFTDEQLSRIRDGAPCPCASGRAVQQCHRS